MAISIAQYVDLLFKKLQGVAKTANSTVKSASNESIASPAFIRGDIVWMESNQIPATAQTVAGVTQALTGTNAVECTADTTVPPIGSIRPTWLSNETYWVPQEFGSTWLPKVFVGPSGAANIEATGTQIFAAGISGTSEYYFDTQAGVLNFIGETIPSVLSVGNVVYISGYQYVGALGVQNNPGNVNLGNLTVSNTTISANIANADITLTPSGTGVVIIDTTTGLVIPTGNTAQQPSPAATGTVRFNTDSTRIEVYDGVEWDSVAAGVTNQLTTGDGSTLVFTLDRDSTTAATLIMFNGVVQIPTVAYTVTGNLVTFAEAPLSTDVIDIRFL
jgi:hypothetical protein